MTVSDAARADASGPLAIGSSFMPHENLVELGSLGFQMEQEFFFTLILGIGGLGVLLANKTQSSHRITAGGKRRVAIPGVLVAATLSRGGGAFLGSCDRVYASSATLSFRG